jgi:GNAT superfamily N-acetyltransferase
VGFLSLREHSARSFEIEVLAVPALLHRRGIGSALVRHGEDWLRSRGVEFVHVKTLGPSRPDPYYARTRAFYQAMGFRPLFESTAFWGDEHPSLVLVKWLK